VYKGIKKGRISERSGPRMIPAAFGEGYTKRLQPPRATKYGRKGCSEEDHPLRKLHASVVVVVWLVVVLTTAVASGRRNGVMSDSV
jgi:hypothetical protein